MQTEMVWVPHHTMLLGHILVLFQLEGPKSVMLAITVVETVTFGWRDKGEDVKPERFQSLEIFSCNCMTRKKCTAQGSGFL